MQFPLHELPLGTAPLPGALLLAKLPHELPPTVIPPISAPFPHTAARQRGPLLQGVHAPPQRSQIHQTTPETVPPQPPYRNLLRRRKYRQPQDRLTKTQTVEGTPLRPEGRQKRQFQPPPHLFPQAPVETQTGLRPSRFNHLEAAADDHCLGIPAVVRRAQGGPQELHPTGFNQKTVCSRLRKHSTAHSNHARPPPGIPPKRSHLQLPHLQKNQTGGHDPQPSKRQEHRKGHQDVHLRTLIFYCPTFPYTPPPFPSPPLPFFSPPPFSKSIPLFLFELLNSPFGPIQACARGLRTEAREISLLVGWKVKRGDFFFHCSSSSKCRSTNQHNK